MKPFLFSAVQTLIIILLFSGCHKKKENTGSEMPLVTIGNVSQERAATNSIFHFTVSLGQVSNTDVSMHFSTIAGSAEENKDFIPATGTLTIPANTKSATIDVTVTADSLRKPNQEFFVQLDNLQQAKFIESKGKGTIINENGPYLPVDHSGYSTPDTYPGYQSTWSDEFNGKSINTADWNFEQGNNNGWGNNELENYTGRPQNAFVSSGNLIIEARAENYNGNAYTSARMTTQNKQSFQFGRMDIRARLPAGKGVWPAIWMLGNTINSAGWPACGEIDIMEVLGQEPRKVYGTLHYGGSFAQHASTGSSYLLPDGSFDQQFHVFSLLWKQDSIEIRVDDQPYLSATMTGINNVYPFNNPFFFILNVAVGGNWPGAPDNATPFPARMFVDYIRVFRKN